MPRFVPNVTSDMLAENAVLHQEFWTAGGSLFANPEVGMTLVVMPIGEGMFEVATAYCNPSDVFSYDYGINLALGRFFDGGTTKVKATDEDAVQEHFYGMAIGAIE